MFDFIFRRRSAKSSPAPALAAQNQPQDDAPSPLVAKQAALAQAEQLAGDETAAVAFIVQCVFADARLAAAQHIHTRPMLERVLQAMRNTDRRVAKLMQSRIDLLKQQEANEHKARQCLTDAERLVHQPLLAVNQVAELDRAWQAINVLDESLRRSFERVRAILRERLEAQTRLQHAVIDVIARLRKIQEDAGAATPEDFARALELLVSAMGMHQAAPEAISLPRHLVAEFEQLHRQANEQLAFLSERRALIEQRQQKLNAWEAQEPALLKAHVLHQEWQSLPALCDGAVAAELTQRFEQLLSRVAVVRELPQPVVPREDQEVRQRFDEALRGMEEALEAGALQAAAECDKGLRSLDITALRISSGQTSRLAKARAELARLQGWARWGGHVSREELLKAAEALPGQALVAQELAKKVGSLRERWKSLDASAGPASRELWERFDAACSTAYALAAAHFKKLAEERERNVGQAQALIDEVRQFAATSVMSQTDTTPDWKSVAGFYTRVSQAWQRQGPIDRKDKKRLNAEFMQALALLSEPLSQQRSMEIARREQLIEEVQGLNPDERTAADALRLLQERWQQQAKSLPLERHDEQALWQRFRAACDTFFDRRKEVATAADADRRQHLRVKEDLCTRLEAAINVPDEATSKTLREVQNAWDKIGPVPRASEQQVETRYRAAVAALHGKVDQARQNALKAEREILHAKVRLCQTVEAALLPDTEHASPMLDQWRAEWQALGRLSSAFEQAMQRRFDAALHAVDVGDRSRVIELDRNRATLSHELLRCEILQGIESPAALSRERLRLQVEVLQTSLRGRPAVPASDERLLQLCALPAMADAEAAQRLGRLIVRWS